MLANISFLVRRLLLNLSWAYPLPDLWSVCREHGAKLQTIYDKRQRTEMDIARREQEIKQLKGMFFQIVLL